MRQGDEALVRRLGKALQVQLENDTHELLPRRWVDLIQYLDEQERRQQQTTVFQARQSSSDGLPLARTQSPVRPTAAILVMAVRD